MMTRISVSMLSGAAALLLLAGPAEAQMRRASPQPSDYVYLIGEYDYYSAKGGSLNGGGLGLGWRFARNFALEGGGQYATKSGVDVKVFYGQALFVYPVSSRLELTASIGGAYLDASTKVLATTVSASSSGYRAGFGVNYWMTPSWSLRLGFHRQNAGGVADDIGAGISYRF